MTGSPAEIARSIADAVAPHVGDGGPGLVVGVRRGGEAPVRAAFGLAHIPFAVPLTPRTLMPLASVTKPMTALCALQAAAGGLVDIDAPVGDYLPDLSPASRRPTLRQLMTHLSGLRCHLDLEVLGGFEVPRPAGLGLETMTALTTANAAPGAWQVYGNSGFHLVSLALARVTGRPFEELMSEFVFAPLAMDGARMLKAWGAVVPGLTSSYSRGPDGGWTDVGHLRMDNLGEGGAAASLDDMLAFAQALRTEDARLPAAIWRELKTPAVGADGRPSGYGLGLALTAWRGVEGVGHSGSLFGVATTTLSAPAHGLDVVVLANTDLPTDTIAREILGAVLGEAALSPQRPKARLEAYPGLDGAVFVSPDLVFGIRDADGAVGLMLQGAPGPALELEPDGGFGLAGSTGPITLRLPDGPAGRRASLSMGGEVQEGVRAADPPPSPQAVAQDAAGAYVNDEIGARIEVRLENGRLTVSTANRHGSSAGEATPLAADILAVATPLARYLLRLARSPEGVVEGLGFHTSRTRALPFRRV